MEVLFQVENAGCATCAERVRAALERTCDVTAIEVDEHADVATVRGTFRAGATEADVGAALEAASDGSGHAYRVRPGSWAAEPRG